MGGVNEVKAPFLLQISTCAGITEESGGHLGQAIRLDGTFGSSCNMGRRVGREILHNLFLPSFYEAPPD